MRRRAAAWLYALSRWLAGGACPCDVCAQVRATVGGRAGRAGVRAAWRASWRMGGRR